MYIQDQAQMFLWEDFENTKQDLTAKDYNCLLHLIIAGYTKLQFEGFA